MIVASCQLAAAFAWAWLGFLALSLAMARHHADAFGSARPPPVRSLRLSGTVALAASLICCIWRDGGPVGTTTWFGVAAAAGLLVALMHSYRPRHTPKFAVAGAGLAVVAHALALIA